MMDHGSATSAPLVIFDLDGTLADTAGDLMGALNAVLAQDDVAPLPLDQARTLLGAGGRALIERGFAVSGRSLDERRLGELYRDFLAHYEAHILDCTTVFPNAIAALDRLETDGCRFAVCTNKMERTANILLEALRIHHRFAAVCGQDTFAFHKPDGRTLPAVVAQAGGAMRLSLMVGDSISDIAAAHNAGIPVIAVDFGYTDVPVTELGPDAVISDFRDLPDAVKALLSRVDGQQALLDAQVRNP